MRILHISLSLIMLHTTTAFAFTIRARPVCRTVCNNGRSRIQHSLQQKYTNKRNIYSTRHKSTLSVSLNSNVSLQQTNSIDNILANFPGKSIFNLELPEGQCLGLQLDNDSDDSNWTSEYLHPDEIRYGVDKYTSNDTRRSFYIGRLALRTLLKQTNVDIGNNSILKDIHGRPCMPAGYLGSISHKPNVGVALISHSIDYQGVGVDIEYCSEEKSYIARKILTNDEQASLGSLSNVSADEEVLLRFSLKESLYKAMHPLICQYVGFQEAQVQPLNDGTSAITLDLKSQAHCDFCHVQAHWRKIESEDVTYFLTSAIVRRNTPPPDHAVDVLPNRQKV